MAEVDGSPEEFDAELQATQTARQDRTPESRSAEELGPEAAAQVEGYVAQLEYASQLTIGAWDGRLDERMGPDWEIAGYVAEKATNAEQAARGIARSISDTKGWTSPPAAAPAPATTGFDEGDQPAVRRRSPTGPYLSFSCYFCGEQQLKLSDFDRAADPYRVELYCDNRNCEAREVVVLLRRGAGTHERADVAALETLDRSGTARDARS